ncbi:MAG TPA: hypothetical protein PKC18_12780 [Lacipirellulaceae bacterium]|nr:hypothetical protein [Lacipirellulaceae bacterium]HMP05845.1 hypothetical protein [Lacipirellulaceae bacterium]
MIAAPGYEEYLAELREQVCKKCVSRRPGAPPCAPLGVGCGIEQHLEQLVSICRSVDSALIDPYLDHLRNQICADCAFQDQPVCPCPLKYLLPLAVAAVETVETRKRILAERMARPDAEIPKMA